MLEQKDYAETAEVIKGRLGRRAFMTISRMDVTDILREVSGQAGTRVKSLVAYAITQEMEERGLTFYPALSDVGGKDNIRVVRTNSFIPELVELLNFPNEDNDAKLRAALRQVTVPEPELVAAS